LGSNNNEDGKIKKISGSEKNTTNNRMELLAPINALKEMNPSSQINNLYRLSICQTWNNRVDK